MRRTPKLVTVLLLTALTLALSACAGPVKLDPGVANDPDARIEALHKTWNYARAAWMTTKTPTEFYVAGCRGGAESFLGIDCPEDPQTLKIIAAAIEAGDGIVERTDVKIREGLFDETSASEIIAETIVELTQAGLDLAMAGVL